VAQVLIISAVFPPEPLVSAMLSRDIAESLSKENKVVVLCPNPTRPAGVVFEQKANSENYKVEYLNSFTCPSFDLIGRLRESYSFGEHCANYITKHSNNIDRIYINSWPLFAPYKILNAARKYKIPSILHIQDIYPESLSQKLPFFFRKIVHGLLLPLDKFILHNADRIIGISPNMISYLSETRRIKKEKFEVVRNWQDDKDFIQVQQTKMRPDFVFMYAGSISPSAGVDLLIRAFHKASLPKSRLIIAGSGAEKQKCINLRANLNNDTIEFCEANPSEVAQIQSRADVLLLPLKKGIARTATPSKLTAYLLSGKPVIACVERESDVAQILREGCCGFVIEPENEDSLKIKMKEIYDVDKSDLLVMGKSGREYALTHLSKEVNLKKLVSIIEGVI
jgi:glycosyltransferase involved in cell wall biosynthesis